MNHDRKIIKALQKLALLLGVSMFFGMSLASPAMAQSSNDIDPGASASLTITKLEQPVTQGEPGDGLSLSPGELANHNPIPGVLFAVTQVPLNDPINSAAGWLEASTMTVTEAASRVATVSPNASGITAENGTVAFTKLDVGLYLVEEKSVPAGVVRAAPFLVALPVPMPGSEAAWLYDVHVYPKNSHVQVELEVRDRDAVSFGDLVTWSVRAEIPRGDAPQMYRFTNIFDSGKQILNQSGPTQVFIEGASGVTLDAQDYTVSILGSSLIIDFTSSGLQKLQKAKALDDASFVNFNYQTTINEHGEHLNKTLLCASADCLNAGGDNSGQVFDTATTKWGMLGIITVDEKNPSQRVPGAKFKLFLTEADALSGKNFITVDGVSEWVTDSNGEIRIDGLRYSNFADGATRLPGDPLLRQYWVIMTHVLAGWNGSSKPVMLEVISSEHTHMQVAVLELRRGSSDSLSKTGGKVSSLVIVGAVLFSMGFLSLLKRRKDQHEQKA